MGSNIIASNGQDLDLIFAAFITSPVSNTGIRVATTDIANRYAALSQGSSIGFNTNIIASNGQDLSQIFAATGTLSIYSGSFTAGAGTRSGSGDLLAGVVPTGQSTPAGSTGSFGSGLSPTTFTPKSGAGSGTPYTIVTIWLERTITQVYFQLLVGTGTDPGAAIFNNMQITNLSTSAVTNLSEVSATSGLFGSGANMIRRWAWTSGVTGTTFQSGTAYSIVFT